MDGNKFIYQVMDDTVFRGAICMLGKRKLAQLVDIAQRFMVQCFEMEVGERVPLKYIDMIFQLWQDNHPIDERCQLATTVATISTGLVSLSDIICLTEFYQINKGKRVFMSGDDYHYDQTYLCNFKCIPFAVDKHGEKLLCEKIYKDVCKGISCKAGKIQGLVWDINRYKYQQSYLNYSLVTTYMKAIPGVENVEISTWYGKLIVRLSLNMDK